MENSVTNPIAGMDMDDHDEKKLCEIADDADARGFRNHKQNSYVINNTTSSTSCWTKVTPIAIFILIVLVVLVLILQAITVHQVITNPESSSDNDNVGATDALMGDRTDAPTYQCNFTLDDSMIKQIQKSLDESAAVTDMLLAYILNNTNVLSNNFDSTQSVVNSLVNIVGTLSNLEVNTVTTEAILNDVLAKVQAVLNLQNSTVPYSEPTSCQDIKMANPNSPSGYYHIHSQIMYCNMDELCSSSEGWSRIAYLDMSDATVDSCPGGLKLRQQGSERACGRPDSNPSGCSSLKFDSNGIMYSKICGRVTGYQFGSPDGLVAHQKNIDQPYVDGVSVTRGYPRQHVWTFINGYSKLTNTCPVCSASTVQVQDFIGDDFFCESGNPNYGWSLKFYTHPMWDGMGCGSAEAACCDVTGIPWFNKTMNATTTDSIELRVCGNQPIWDEDTLVGRYEIYVQ